MENDTNTLNETTSSDFMVLTAHELANAIGENYKSVTKWLNVYATEGKISVCEKLVNNRALKGYKVSISDIKEMKKKFIDRKHFSDSQNTSYLQMVTNAYKALNTAENENKSDEDTNVKFYEVMKENAELTKEVDRLKADLTTAKNENVRLDADLTKTRSEIKLIESKSDSMEAAYSEKKIQLEEKERELKAVEGKLHTSRVIIAIYSAVALVVLTVIITVYLMRSFGSI